jgi:hypothetical protein
MPFDKLTVPSNVEGLTALSKAEGLRYPHPLSLRRTSMYASFLGISDALYLEIFHQPPIEPVLRQAPWLSIFNFPVLKAVPF